MAQQQNAIVAKAQKLGILKSYSISAGEGFVTSTRHTWNGRFDPVVSASTGFLKIAEILNGNPKLTAAGIYAKYNTDPKQYLPLLSRIQGNADLYKTLLNNGVLKPNQPPVAEQSIPAAMRKLDGTPSNSKATGPVAVPKNQSITSYPPMPPARSKGLLGTSGVMRKLKGTRS